MKIAVIGAGIGGIASSYLLAKKHDVTLFERDDRLGGHTNTILVDDGGTHIPIDTGFIVCNPRTYPLFYRLLDEWGVARQDSDMSFGFHCERSGVGYTGPSFREFVRKPTNLFQRRFLRLFNDQRRFHRRAVADLAAGQLLNQPLGAYLGTVGVSSFFVDHYLVPIAASVWSSPDGDMLDFPALTFVQFFANHGLLDLRQRPTWQTIVGGSHAYLHAFRSQFTGTLRTNTPVAGIRRTDDCVHIRLGDGTEEVFDRVVCATHANITRRLLIDATEKEDQALGSWRYHRNTVQLHTDESVMPRDRRLWSAWNYHRRSSARTEAPVTMTYWMNRLQSLRAKRDYFVSLNATDRVDPTAVIYQTDYEHPGYSPASIAAQQVLQELNGDRLTYFAGAHMRYGFHEDGVFSAVAVARHFGIDL